MSKKKLELKEMIFYELKLIRVYLKPIGKQTDFDEPMILKQGDTVEEACQKLHREFKSKFRYAIVSGPSAKHSAQNIGLEHIFQDGDILTVVIEK